MVFSGIVEEIGTVVSITESASTRLWDGSVGTGWELVISCRTAREGAYEGASVAVNGVCLTVTHMGDGTLSFGLAPETIRRSNLGQLRAGESVNLERSLAVGARNSGHFVQGHVDATGVIMEKWREGDSLWIKVQPPAELMPYIVPKGYIAVDGTSLTVCEVNTAEAWFTFMLIEYTQRHIIVPHKLVGGLVNLEVDVMGKYAAKAVESVTASMAALREQLERGLADVASKQEELRRELEAVKAQRAE